MAPAVAAESGANRGGVQVAHDLKLPHTTHYHLPLTRSDSIRENQKLEFDLFRQADGTPGPTAVVLRGGAGTSTAR